MNAYFIDTTIERKMLCPKATPSLCLSHQLCISSDKPFTTLLPLNTAYISY